MFNATATPCHTRTHSPRMSHGRQAAAATGTRAATALPRSAIVAPDTHPLQHPATRQDPTIKSEPAASAPAAPAAPAAPQPPAAEPMDWEAADSKGFAPHAATLPTAPVAAQPAPTAPSPVDPFEPLTAAFLKALDEQSELHTFEGFGAMLTHWFSMVTCAAVPGAAARALMARVARALLHRIVPKVKDPEVAQRLVLGQVCLVPQSRELAEALATEICAAMRDGTLRHGGLLIIGLSEYHHELCADHQAARILARLIAVCSTAPLPLRGAAWRGVLATCFTLPDPRQRAAVLGHALATWLDNSPASRNAFEQAQREMNLDELATELVRSHLKAWEERAPSAVGMPMRAQPLEPPMQRPSVRRDRPSSATRQHNRSRT